MSDEIKIFVGDVNDVEGHVFARLNGVRKDHEEGGEIVLSGTLQGPYCATARTLPAKIPFRDLAPEENGLAVAIVPDPCVWSPELPHLYQADVEARQGDRIIAEYHGMIGLRGANQKREDQS
jgi:beta-galactosidase/beta-glucuronidase